MAKRAAITILLITRQGLVRADLSRQHRLLGLWQQPRPELRDLPALAEAALQLGPKPGRLVWVLSTDLWTQTLELPAQKTAGISNAELAGALNFEVEALSGLNAFEAVVGHAAVGVRENNQLFWVVQARTADIEQLGDTICKSGARLAGVAHPGGLCRRSLTHEDGRDGSWQRIELWPDAVLALEGGPNGAADVHLSSSDPEMGRWKADVADWQQKREPPQRRELLVAAGITVPAEVKGQRLVRLDDDDHLKSWLVAVAEQLALKEPKAPLIRPAPRPLSVGQRRGIAVALAIAVLVLCFAHYQVCDWRIKAASTESNQLQEPARRLPELQKQVANFEAKRDTMKQEIEQLNHSAARLTKQRERLARLLVCLAENSSEDLLVQRIDSDTGDPRIHGVCLKPELADQFARTLAEKLRPFGWEVQAPKKQAKNLVAGGVPGSLT